MVDKLLLEADTFAVVRVHAHMLFTPPDMC